MLKGLENNLQKKIKKIKAFIENLKDYSKNIDLISLSKFKTGVRDTAKMLYYLNEEKKSVKKIGNKRVRSLVAINNKRLMKNGINKLNNVIEDSIRQSIEESLILSEQISYLAYSVQLTPAKEKPLSYKKRLLERSKRASRNQVVWPVKSEIWSDEVPLYKSLLEKRCL
jgi:flagellar biosynthesis chaperone FliJ